MTASASPKKDNAPSHEAGKANDPQQLILDHLDLWTGAISQKSTSGRGSRSKLELTGIQKLRKLILELAFRGKLIGQDPSDEPALSLIQRLREANANRLSDKKAKKSRLSSRTSDEERLSDIPKSWQWVRLGELVEVLDSQRRPITKSNRTPGPYPYYGASGVVDYVGDYIFDEPLILVGEDGAKWESGESTAFSINGKTWVNNHAHVLRPNRDAVDDSYLVYSLTAQDLSDFITGMTVPKLNQARLISIPIAIAPLAEQHRIVTKVDELMALCDQLETQTYDSISAHETLVETLLGTLTQPGDNAELAENWARLAEHFDTLFTTEHSIEQLKQTILQLAVMGKLVPQHSGEGSEPSCSFPEKMPFDLPAGWAWCQLKNLMSDDREISYGIIKLEKEPAEGGIPTLRCSDVRPRSLALGSVRKVSLEIEENYKRTRLKGGEVVMNIRGTLGGVALIPPELAGFNIAREVAMLPISDYVSGKYIVNLIASPFFLSMIEKNLKGIAYKGLNLGALKEFHVPLPPKEEQEKIVNMVDELMSLCDRLLGALVGSARIKCLLAESLKDSSTEQIGKR